MNKFKSVFASFSNEKFYRDQEGNLIIPHSVISDEIIDRDGEVVTATAMKNAIDDYMQFANIREMHQPIAIGVTQRIWQDGKKTLIEAKIVAEEAIKKIEQGVLKGFSIGFQVLEKVGNTYTKIKIFEISAVDIPSNYSALIGSKSYEPLNNLLEKEESMQENENKNVADVEATQEATKEVDTTAQVDVSSQEDTFNKEEAQALEVEAIDQLTKELEEIKKSFEAVKVENESLKAEAIAKEEEFASTKEAAKGYKSLSVVHKKYKEENEQLKAEMVTLKAELEALKNIEVNVKTSAPADVVEKSFDASKYIVNEAPKELMSAAAIINAKMFK